MTTKQDLHRLIDELPESAVPEAGRVLEGLRNGDGYLPPFLRDAPWDDEPLTETELKAIEEAREDIRAGRVFTHEEVKRWLLDEK
jgi:hypothetical protein